MSTTIWAVLFLFSFAATVLFTLHLLLRTLSRSWQFGDRIGATFAIFAAAVMAVDGLQLLNCFDYQQFQPWSSFLPIVAVLGYGWLCLRGWSLQNTHGMELIKQPLVSCLLVTTMTISGWSWHRLYSAGMMADLALDCCSPGELVEEQRYIGITDSGVQLPLYRVKVSNDHFEKFAEACRERISKLAEPLIVRAEPCSEYNCHGWVFTGGKHLLRGENVEQILASNGYSQIAHPKENDVVIYRSPLGRILHTGLVSTILSDKTILVESKWGVDGRYLHKLEDQPYSQNFEFYRGSRGSHVIAFQSNENAAEVVTLSALQSPLATSN